LLAFPNCKINLGLNVIEKRADGFHNIESVFIPAGWQDILEIIPTENEKSEAEIRSSGIRVYGNKEDNLIYKAYRLLAEKYNLPGVKIHLHKLIPIGAGLGGGSSDAVSALQLLNKIFKLNLADDELEKFSLQIGSDCPFFLKNKPVFVSGKGEIFEPLSIRLRNFFAVIVKPRIHISTSE
jgi:4-diphosphocytidyl-2-C-methyl-D-erythritol kinase